MELIDSLTNQITIIGMGIAALGVVLLGCIVIFKSLKGGGGLRDALSGVGGVAIGIILIGAATTIVGAIETFAESL